MATEAWPDLTYCVTSHNSEKAKHSGERMFISMDPSKQPIRTIGLTRHRSMMVVMMT